MQGRTTQMAINPERVELTIEPNLNTSHRKQLHAHSVRR